MNLIRTPHCFMNKEPKGKTVSPGESERGALAPHAASVLMKLLYAARIARFDLLRSINSLARNVTKWTIDDDAKVVSLNVLREFQPI